MLSAVYHRTVLVLFAKDREVEILLNAGGVPYALKILRKANPLALTEEDRKTAQYVVHRLSSQDQATKTAMADLAVRWGDSNMWKRIVKASGAEQNINTLGKNKFVEGWKKFSFDAVQSTYV